MRVSKNVRHFLLTTRDLVPYLGDIQLFVSPSMALNFWLLETTGSSSFGLSATSGAASRNAFMTS
jgi:hypothetical protein